MKKGNNFLVDFGNGLNILRVFASSVKSSVSCIGISYCCIFWSSVLCHSFSSLMRKQYFLWFFTNNYMEYSPAAFNVFWLSLSAFVKVFFVNVILSSAT